MVSHISNAAGYSGHPGSACIHDERHSHSDLSAIKAGGYACSIRSESAFGRKVCLQKELKDLCGDKGDGEIDKAWKTFEERKKMISEESLGDMSSAEAHALYQLYDERRRVIVKDMDGIKNFYSFISSSVSCCSQAKDLLVDYKSNWEGELAKLCGTGWNGEINKAWQSLEAQRVKFPSEPTAPSVLAALGLYQKLDERRTTLESLLTRIDCFIANVDLIKLEENLPYCELLSNELHKDEKSLEREHKELCGNESNGIIDKAWKMYKAMEALELYQMLDGRRKTIEACLSEIERTSTAASVLAPMSDSRSVGGCASSYAETSDDRMRDDLIRFVLGINDSPLEKPSAIGHLSECDCEPFDRKRTSLRKDIETYVLQEAGRKGLGLDPAKPLEYISIGSGNLLPDFIMLAKLILQGHTHIHIRLVDRDYKEHAGVLSGDLSVWKSKVRELTAALRLLGAEIEVSPYVCIDDVKKGMGSKKIDILYAVDIMWEENLRGGIAVMIGEMSQFFSLEDQSSADSIVAATYGNMPFGDLVRPYKGIKLFTNLREMSALVDKELEISHCSDALSIGYRIEGYSIKRARELPPSKQAMRDWGYAEAMKAWRYSSYK